MSFKTLLQTEMLLVGVVLLAGCELQYNGTPTFGQFKTPDSKDTAETKIDVTENTQATADDQAGWQNSSQNPSQFVYNQPKNTQNQQSNSNDYTDQMATFAAKQQTAAIRQKNSHVQLGLFGKVANRSPQLSSPLDGTSNITQVTFTTEGADFDPEVSPDGEHLAYASTQHRPESDIYVKRVNGSTVTQITSDPAPDVMPTFSPDGDKLAFASLRSGNWDIYIVNIDGGAPIQLTNGTTDDIHPSFSPDGSKLVYCRKGGLSGQWEMIVVDLDIPARKTVIGYGMFPQWSPVDDRILFQRARERGTLWFSIWTVELEEGEAKRPTEIAVSANAAAITPSWSPDGQQIVFCTVIKSHADNNNGPTQADVWTVAADGTSRRNLVHNKFLNVQPVWAQDGAVYFVSNRANNAMENIWSLKPREIQILNESTGQLQQPSAMVPTQ